jgi:hypothetical protein
MGEIINVSRELFKGKDQFEYFRADGIIILKEILKEKEGVGWIHLA